MKKFFPVLFAFLMIIGLTSCGESTHHESHDISDSNNPEIASTEDVKNAFLQNRSFRVDIESINETGNYYNLEISFVGENARQDDPSVCAIDVDRLIEIICENNQSVYKCLGTVIFNCPSDEKNFQTSIQIQEYKSGDDIAFCDTMNDKSELVVITKEDVDSTKQDAQKELDEELSQRRDLNIGDTLYSDNKISIVYNGVVEYETVYAADNLDVPKSAIVFSVVNKTGQNLTIGFFDLHVNGVDSGHITSHSISANQENLVEVRFDELPEVVEDIHASGNIMFDDYSTSDFKF